MGQKQTRRLLWEAAEDSAAEGLTPYNCPPRAKPEQRRGPVG